MEISLRTLIHSLGQDQSTLAQRAETTVTEFSLTSCVWARFLAGSHTMPGQRHSQPNPTSLVEGWCVFRCNLPPALLEELPGSFTCHCGNTGVERTQNKNQHTKLSLEKKILPPLLPGFELATYRSRVRLSSNKLSRLPLDLVHSMQSDGNLLSTKWYRGLISDHTAVLRKLDVSISLQKPETFVYRCPKKRSILTRSIRFF